MKRWLTVFAGILTFCALMLPAAWAADCSCTAPDGSCSCSVSCKGECAAVCASGSCGCCCSGLCLALNAPVSIDATQVPVATVSQLLSKASGQKVEAVAGSEQLVTLKLVKATLIDAVRELQNTPGVRIHVNGQAVMTVTLPLTARISVCFTEVDAELALQMIRQATGWNLEFGASPGQRITLKATGTASEIVQQLAGAAGVRAP